MEKNIEARMWVLGLSGKGGVRVKHCSGLGLRVGRAVSRQSFVSRLGLAAMIYLSDLLSGCQP